MANQLLAGGGGLDFVNNGDFLMNRRLIFDENKIRHIAQALAGRSLVFFGMNGEFSSGGEFEEVFQLVDEFGRGESGTVN